MSTRRLRMAIGAMLVFATGGVAAPARSQAYADGRAAAATQAAVFAMSATLAASERIADDRLARERKRVLALAEQLRRARADTSSARKEVATLGRELEHAQAEFVAQLAARDAAYAAEVAVFRKAVTDIAATPDGLAALEQFNAGNEIGALAILDRLRQARAQARATAAAIETAEEARRVARLALDANIRGRVPTGPVIERYQELVRLDPSSWDDWHELSLLLRREGRVSEALAAIGRAVAASAGESRILMLESRAALLLRMEDQAGAAATAKEARVLALSLTEKQPQLASTYWLLARVLARFAETERLTGELASARITIGLAIKALRALLPETPRTARLDVELALALRREMLIVRELGDMNAANRAGDEAIALLRTRLAEEPTSLSLKEDLARTLFVAQNSETLPNGAPGGRFEAITLAREIVAARPDEVGSMRELATFLLEEVLARLRSGDVASARSVLAESLALRRRIVAKTPEDSDAQQELARALDATASLADKRDQQLRDSARREALEIRRRLANNFPTSRSFARDLATSLTKVAGDTKRDGRPAAALPFLREELPIRKKLLLDPPSRRDQESHAECLARIAELTGAPADWAAAQKALRALTVMGPLSPQLGEWLRAADAAVREQSGGAL